MKMIFTRISNKTFGDGVNYKWLISYNLFQSKIHLTKDRFRCDHHNVVQKWMLIRLDQGPTTLLHEKNMLKKMSFYSKLQQKKTHKNQYFLVWKKWNVKFWHIAKSKSWEIVTHPCNCKKKIYEIKAKLKWSKIFLTQCFHDAMFLWCEVFMTRSFHDAKFLWRKVFMTRNFHDAMFHAAKISWCEVFMTQSFHYTKFSWHKVFMTRNFYDTIFSWREVFMMRS